MTIEEKIFQNQKFFPDKVAIISADKSITYSEMWRKIIQAAAYFRNRSDFYGGCRVIVSASNEIEFVFAYFGLHLAGGICVPVDPQINLTRLNRIMESANPCFLMGQIINADLEIIPYSVFKDFEGEWNTKFPEKNNVADLLFTTGTTGLPKGVALTYENELSAAININSFIRNSDEDIELLALPISHSFGLGRLRCVLYKGATLDLIAGFANIKRFFAEIQNRNITGFSMVPSSWAYIKKMSGSKLKEYSSQIKYIEIGSAHMSLEDKMSLIELLPDTRICMHYGLTEASRSSFIEFHSDSEYLDSIGKPSPNVSIKIFNEKGCEVEDRGEGEICVKGLHVCSNYWGMSERDFSENFNNQYFKTGDWGYKNSEGYIFLKSRKKEIINIGGKKVSPIEVEEVLNQIDGISESVCIGIPDPNGILGEVIKAFVVSDNEIVVSSIMKILNDKLENYKIPVEIERIASIPKTLSGKIQRLLLRENLDSY